MANPLDRRSYRKVYRRLWTNPDFTALSDADKLMGLYLLSGPQTNRVGLLRLNFAGAGQDLRTSLFGARRRTGKVCQSMDWSFDEVCGVVWIPTWWSFNQVKQETNLKGMLTDLNDVPSQTPLLLSFCNNLEDIPVALRYLFDEWREVALKEQRKSTARSTAANTDTSTAPITDTSTARATTVHPSLPELPDPYVHQTETYTRPDVHGDGDQTETETERKDKSSAADGAGFPQGLLKTTREPTEPTPEFVRRVAYQVMDEYPDEGFTDWKDRLKERLSRLKASYDAATVGEALETAIRLRDLDTTKRKVGV